MPSTYAHFRLGCEAERLLPESLKTLADDNFDCFALGLHGPDLLFYYKPLTNNPTNAIGYAIHEKYASEFFTAAAKTFEARGKRPEDEAYLLGFLCHFALDSEAHPFVNAEMTAKNLTHTEIESAFDKYLLEKDGKNPFKTDLTAHILCTERTQDVAAAYFGVDKKKAKKALKSIKFYNRIMRCHSPFARAIITALLKVSGMWEIMHGMILPVKHDERWNDAIAELEGAYSVAADKAADLMINYDGFLHGKCPLSTLLDRDFE